LDNTRQVSTLLKPQAISIHDPEPALSTYHPRDSFPFYPSKCYMSQPSKSFSRCFLTLILYESIPFVRVSYNMKQVNCNFIYLNIWSRYSSVQKVTWLWARRQMDHGSIPGRGKTCLFSKAFSPVLRDAL